MNQLWGDRSPHNWGATTPLHQGVGSPLGRVLLIPKSKPRELAAALWELLAPGHLAGHPRTPAAEDIFTDTVLPGVFKANIPVAPTSLLCSPF